MHSVAIVGGTGPQGKGLGFRFAHAGHRVIIGSRTPERAQETADELAERLATPQLISGESNEAAAAQAEVVLIAVPFDGYRESLMHLAPALDGKIVISCVNPLGFDKRGAFGLTVPEGSAAELAADLAPRARVTSAFHHVSAVNLLANTGFSGEDVLVCGDDKDAKDVVRRLAEAVAGKPGIDAGPLRVARQLEPFTAVLISINKRYKAHSGVAISGLPSDLAVVRREAVNR